MSGCLITILPTAFFSYCKIQENSTDLTDLRGAGKLWPGKDYVNYLVKDFVEVDQAFSGTVFILPTSANEMV